MHHEEYRARRNEIMAKGRPEKRSIAPDEHIAYRQTKAAEQARPNSQGNVAHLVQAHLRKVAENVTDADKLQVLTTRKAELARAGRNTGAYDSAIAKLEASIRAQAEQKAWLKSDEYTTSIDTVRPVRELVERFTPEHLDEIDAAIEIFTRHDRNVDSLFSAVAKASSPATVAECTARLAAEAEAAKAASELASASAQRLLADNENAALVAATKTLQEKTQ